MRRKRHYWTHQELAEWEKIRNKGRMHYTLRNGLMLLAAILVIFTGGTVGLFIWQKAKAANLIPELIIIALICFAVGIGNSLIAWSMEERSYHKFKREEKEKNESGKEN